MTKRHSMHALLGAFLAANCGAAAQAEDLLTNRLLAAQCAQCHGTNGQAVGDMESLVGEDDLYDELQEMLVEGEADDIMAHQAQGYTDEQMRRIAAYFAGQRARRSGSRERAHD